jgi:hypothetical protein
MPGYSTSPLAKGRQEVIVVLRERKLRVIGS